MARRPGPGMVVGKPGAAGGAVLSDLRGSVHHDRQRRRGRLGIPPGDADGASLVVR
jgi:hypothetical protein